MFWSIDANSVRSYDASAMRHFCTLFDFKYIPQGLALYESLVRHSSEDFTLDVLAMDDSCAEALRAMNLEHAGITRLSLFEIQDPSLVSLRKSRTWQEFCWTMGSVFTDLVMQFGGVNEITYLDADMMFFSDPKVIFDEIGDRSIAVIPHRLIRSKKHLEVNGKFNVSWVTFRNTPNGRECLSTWAAQCRERCSAKEGCGDQLYLDAWPAKYGDDLCVIQNLGAGLAPWNLANYRLTEGPAVDGRPVVFYHYHELSINGPGNYRLTNYELRPEDVDLIYSPYLAEHKKAKERIASAVYLPA